MNDHEIGEIQDVIGMLGDVTGSVEENTMMTAGQCAERLYKLIRPYLDEEQTR